jgi:pimeloyl-ACP methyl ester carboxylesterase
VLALPALVLLPGLDGTGKLFQAFRQRLPDSIDSRIVGYPTDEPLGYEELLDRLTPQLPASPYFLLAESFSGPLGLRIAALHPENLRGLILSASFARNPLPWAGWASPLAQFVPLKSLPRWLRAVLMWGSGRARAAPAKADRALSGVDRAVLRRRVRAVLAVDDRHLLSLVRVPVLLISARRDRIIPRRAGELLRQGLAHAEHQEIDGPHLLLQAAPCECAQAVVAFIDRHGN